LSAGGNALAFEPFNPGPPEKLPAVHAVLRERFPVYRGDSNIWVILRFDGVKAVQSNPAVFSSRPNPYEGDSAPAEAEMKPEVIERLIALTAGIPVDMRRDATEIAVERWLAFVRAVCVKWIDSQNISRSDLAEMCLRAFHSTLDIPGEAFSNSASVDNRFRGALSRPRSLSRLASTGFGPANWLRHR
jgi:hypothetical protein